MSARVQAVVNVGEVSLEDKAARIRDLHKEVVCSLRNSVAYAILCGQLLHEAKKLVPHGAWAAWIYTHTKLSTSTARGYMRLAGLPAENQQRVADLPLREALKQVVNRGRKQRDREAPPPRIALAPPPSGDVTSEPIAQEQEAGRPATRGGNGSLTDIGIPRTRSTRAQEPARVLAHFMDVARERLAGDVFDALLAEARQRARAAA